MFEFPSGSEIHNGFSSSPPVCPHRTQNCAVKQPNNQQTHENQLEGEHEDYLYWLAIQKTSIAHLDGRSCFCVGTVSYKTKTFVPLNSNLFNSSSTKKMEKAVEVELGNLQIICTKESQKWYNKDNRNSGHMHTRYVHTNCPLHELHG